MKFDCSFYQDTYHSRFVHPLEAHKNKHVYNNKQGIPNNKKAWELRNTLYNEKYIFALWLNQLLRSFFQCGSNLNEVMHHQIKHKFSWILKQIMSCSRIAPLQEKITFSYNWAKVQKMHRYEDEQKKKVPLWVQHDWDPEFNEAMYKIYDKATSLQTLREEKAQSPSKQCLLYWPKTDRHIPTLLHGFNYKDAIKKQNYKRTDQYSELCDLLIEYNDENNQKYSCLYDYMQTNPQELLRLNIC